ncbi:MAG TPA: RNA-binding S4 domain-containing protein [Candidatus Eremiobacteraceae bacterium]|nr:RNA-binding S4 domain-containing protein [Candidatus Eremiobacteraceae bacterium]
MRLDKFLKVSRLAKRRSEAKEALDARRIECAGKPVKASYTVKPGDELTIHYATRTVRVRVEAVPERPAQKTSPHELYSILGDVRSR